MHDSAKTAYPSIAEIPRLLYEFIDDALITSRGCALKVEPVSGSDADFAYDGEEIAEIARVIGAVPGPVAEVRL